MMLKVLKNQRGQGFAEYGLIIAGIAIVAIVAIFFLGGRIGAMFEKMGIVLQGAAPGQDTPSGF